MIAKGIEPFSQIRKNVDSLGSEEGLSVIAPFIPSPLIEKLGSEGFRTRVERKLNGSWIAYFWRED